MGRIFWSTQGKGRLRYKCTIGDGHDGPEFTVSFPQTDGSMKTVTDSSAYG